MSHRSPRVLRADVVVVGAGAAGISAALELAEELSVVVVTKTPFAEGGSTALAQGGVAVAIGDGDAPELHAADTVSAGAGLVDPARARLLAEEGPAAVAQLIAAGARFDRNAEGALALGREAAHGRARILHAQGDATGAEVLRALSVAVAEHPRIQLAARIFAADLVVRRGRVVGVEAVGPDGAPLAFYGGAVVLATGGYGQLYRFTTNPPEVTGDGLAMALRAGARVADLEMVQFHPTALAIDRDPLPLLTEALRGEGAIVVDERGDRFLRRAHEAAELAPRDVVARAIARQLAEGGRAFLDARTAVGERFPERFPTVFAACREVGLDPRVDRLPIVPAAHYAMGGVAVDADGHSSLPGLWACGEAASTGVHGANRLASNSLLEALVFGRRAGRSVRVEGGAPWLHEDPAIEVSSPPGGEEVGALRNRLRETMSRSVGLLRDEAGLSEALSTIDEIAAAAAAGRGELRNLTTVARAVTLSALARPESRGAHFRTDYPRTDPAFAWRPERTLAELESELSVAPLRAGEHR